MRRRAGALGQRVAQATRERRCDPSQDGWIILAQSGEVAHGSFNTIEFAERPHRGGPLSVGEEGNFADRPARHFGHAAPAGLHGKTTGTHEIEGIGFVARANENFAPANGNGDETLLESGK